MSPRRKRRTGAVASASAADSGASAPSGEARATASPRTVALYGALVLVVQLALMLAAQVPAPHNGGDNAGYLALAQEVARGGYVEGWDPERVPHTKYPPVFPILLAVWIGAGATSWSALKSLPALFTTVSVLAVYLWVARRRSPLQAAGIALLLSASSAMLWYSQWLLSEPPFLAFTFISLLALDRARTPRGPPSSAEGDDPDFGPTIWFTVGVTAAVLASFTRSAGLPLLAAIGLWLLHRREWRRLGVFVALAGIPTLLWWLRARGVGSVQYVGEFWMVNPYRPELGQVTAGGMITRVLENAQGYLTLWIPQGLVGGQAAWLALLGIVLCLAALVGWLVRSRTALGPAELFFPLYGALILLWPQVWSGDRFALPLFPLVLYYAAEAFRVGEPLIGRWPPRAVLGGGFAFLLLTSLGSWSASVSGASACRAAYQTLGSFSCYGATWAEFDQAARWSGLNLPQGSVVLTRKPRLFYLTSGLQSRTYPFTVDPDAFLASAGAARARYVLLDHIDGQGQRYVEGVIQVVPEAFCSIWQFAIGEGGQPTRLLGLVDPASELGGSRSETEDGQRMVSLPACPLSMAASPPVDPRPLAPGTIPLLAGG